VRFGEDFDVAELDCVRHEQAQRGDEQRGDVGLAGLGRGFAFLERRGLRKIPRPGTDPGAW
jgi:hypothetical protein